MDEVELRGRILVGIDGSTGSEAAMAWALDEARYRDAELEAVFAWHVATAAYNAPGFIPPNSEEIEAQGHQLLEDALAVVSATTHVKVHQRTCEGRPAEVLCHLASDPDVNLVVVGSRGHGGLAELLLGSVSHTLTHHCPKPLVIIPKTKHLAAAQVADRRIVVGVDGSPEADDALRWAASEAHIRAATLEVVVAWSVSRTLFPTRYPIAPWVQAILRHEAERILENSVARLDEPQVIERTLVAGEPADGLTKRAASAELLVVGTRGLGRAREALLGSVSHACAHHSPAPVAIIPYTKETLHESHRPARRHQDHVR